MNPIQRVLKVLKRYSENYKTARFNHKTAIKSRELCKNTNCMVAVIPITDEKADIPIWLPEWHSNNSSIIYNDTSITTRGPLKIERREVEEAPYLILHLELIGPIPTHWDRAVGAQNTILPGIAPVLNPIPTNDNNHRNLHIPHTDKITPTLEQVNYSQRFREDS